MEERTVNFAKQIRRKEKVCRTSVWKDGAINHVNEKQLAKNRLPRTSLESGLYIATRIFTQQSFCLVIGSAALQNIREGR